MRLTDHEVAAIKAAAREAFGETAVVRLFGSRLDDSVKGGDIDLHLEVEPECSDYRHTGNFRWNLMNRIGERAVDVVILERGRAPRRIDRVAMAEGVRL